MSLHDAAPVPVANSFAKQGHRLSNGLASPVTEGEETDHDGDQGFFGVPPLIKSPVGDQHSNQDHRVGDKAFLLAADSRLAVVAGEQSSDSLLLDDDLLTFDDDDDDDDDAIALDNVALYVPNGACSDASEPAVSCVCSDFAAHSNTTTAAASTSSSTASTTACFPDGNHHTNHDAGDDDDAFEAQVQTVIGPGYQHCIGTAEITKTTTAITAEPTLHRDDGLTQLAAAGTPKFYAVRNGEIFQPGLPPTLSLESLKHQQLNLLNNNSNNLRLSKLLNTTTLSSNTNNSNYYYASRSDVDDMSQRSKVKKRRRRHCHQRKNHRKPDSASLLQADDLTRKQHNHKHKHHHHHHRRRQLVPPSSPVIASRHFGADSFITAQDGTSQQRASAPVAPAGAVINMSSFRLILERIKHWFMQKSRKLLRRRLPFRNAYSSSSSMASTFSSISSSSSSSSSSTTSLCDSEPGAGGIRLQVPPIVTVTPSPNGPTKQQQQQQQHGSHDDLLSSGSSCESTSSLLELKKQIVRQRRQRQIEELQQQQQLQQQQVEGQRHRRHRAYLQNAAHTVTSTISCPTGRPRLAPKRRVRPPILVKQETSGGKPQRRRNNPETSTTSEVEHAPLQLSASWPLVDRLSLKLSSQQQAVMLGDDDGHEAGEEDDFYNDGSAGLLQLGGHGHGASTASERRAGWRHYMTQTQDSARDSVCSDCAIPFQDLEFGECVRDSDGHKIFSGRWYGTVMIHLFSSFTDRDVGAFWSEVHKMVTLRHDNVALFMGAAVERSALAIVISVQTHVSLFDQIHVGGASMAGNVLTIGRQLAQGMGYLHSRNIVLGHLNSRNVFIDGKLKISMADCSKPRRDHVKHGSTCLSRGVVSSLAPELIRSLTIVQQQQHINVPPKLCFTSAPTMDTDVYAFGTLMYEVAYCDFPMSGTPLDIVIYQVASGYRQEFDTDPSPTSSLLAVENQASRASINQLIEDCWCHDALSRPFFKDIYRYIQELSTSKQTSVSTEQRRRCTSVPERLNHLSSFQRTGGIMYY